MHLAAVNIFDHVLPIQTIRSFESSLLGSFLLLFLSVPLLVSSTDLVFRQLYLLEYLFKFVTMKKSFDSKRQCEQPTKEGGKGSHHPKLNPKSNALHDEYRIFTFQGRCDLRPHNRSILFDRFTNIRQLYEFGDEIGRGATGVVTQCMDKRTNRLAACKTVLKSSLHTSSDAEDLKRELHILKQMQEGPSAVKYHGAYEDSQVQILNPFLDSQCWESVY